MAVGGGASSPRSRMRAGAYACPAAHPAPGSFRTAVMAGARPDQLPRTRTRREDRAPSLHRKTRVARERQPLSSMRWHDGEEAVLFLGRCRGRTDRFEVARPEAQRTGANTGRGLHVGDQGVTTHATAQYGSPIGYLTLEMAAEHRRSLMVDRRGRVRGPRSGDAAPHGSARTGPDSQAPGTKPDRGAVLRSSGPPRTPVLRRLGRACAALRRASARSRTRGAVPALPRPRRAPPTGARIPSHIRPKDDARAGHPDASRGIMRLT